MKFDCGQTRQERVDHLSKWHSWFAWHPIRVGSHDCRWLEWVERKGVFHPSTFMDNRWIWEYKV